MSTNERVVSYIDGFNLYFGLRSRGRRYLWLDVEKLSRSLLKPHQELVAVRYFTAPVRDDPPAESRQADYLDALTAQCGKLQIYLGRFQRRTKRCRSCASSWADYEEKESDVALAVSMVEDAARDLCDMALLITADSDMCPAVGAVKRIRPGTRVVMAPPPNRRSPALRQACDATFVIGLDKIRRVQLPEAVEVGGRKLRRPIQWT